MKNERVDGSRFFCEDDGHNFEYRIERSESGKWFQLMFMDGEYCGDWLGRRCIYGVKTDKPWIRDPFHTCGKIYLADGMIQALRNAQAA